jgi:hypothetical protein
VNVRAIAREAEAQKDRPSASRGRDACHARAAETNKF